MKSVGCLRAGALIDRRAVGLSMADALRLEEHLAGCEACSEQAEMFAQLRHLAAEVNAPLTSIERGRAIVSALSSVQREPVRSRVLPWRPAMLVFAVCALLGVGLRATNFAGQGGPVAAVGRAPVGGANAARSDRVLSGDVLVQGQARTSGAALENDATLQSSAGATLALAQAHVELRPGTRGRWSQLDHTLHLETGSVVADVDPSAHARFVVRTERFSVVVLGTRFEVSPGGVSVTRGRVQVLAADGRPLAQLGAGERFVADSGPGQSAEAAAAVHTETAANEAPPRSAGAVPPNSGSTAAQPVRVHRDAAALLADARAQLASKQVARAKRLIDAALALRLDDTARAEALTLRAECALVEGDKAAAVGAYLRVARSFAPLAAGENALFAAARIEAERNERASATRWLTRYLERYPRGRFVQEAHRRLRELTPPVDHAP